MNKRQFKKKLKRGIGEKSNSKCGCNIMNYCMYNNIPVEAYFARLFDYLHDLDKLDKCAFDDCLTVIAGFDMAYWHDSLPSFMNSYKDNLYKIVINIWKRFLDTRDLYFPPDWQDMEIYMKKTNKAVYTEAIRDVVGCEPIWLFKKFEKEIKNA